MHGFRYYFTPLKGVLFTFPSRYLSTIGCRRVFSLTSWSRQIPMGLLVSHGTWVSNPESLSLFAYRAITSCGQLFQAVQLSNKFLTLWPVCILTRSNPTTPKWQCIQACTPFGFGLIPVRSPLLGESLLFSFPWSTKMFQFLQLSPHILFYSDMGSRTLLRDGFPIRKSPDQSLFATPRSLSQLTTSFIDFRHQGILHTPLVAF